MNSVDLFPLYLSLKVAFSASIVAFCIGIPIAYFLSRNKTGLARLIDNLTNLPIILPPTVLGYYLLVLLGRQSMIGSFLEKNFNIMIIFTPTGAIIAASIVSVPFLIRSSRAAFMEVDEDYLNAARLLGRGEINIFLTVVIPIAWRGVMAGVTMAFARALGDFGATLMVSGSIPEKTLTMPIAIYDSLQSGNTDMVNLLVAVMTGTAFIVLFVIGFLERKNNIKGI